MYPQRVGLVAFSLLLQVATPVLAQPEGLIGHLGADCSLSDDVAGVTGRGGVQFADGILGAAFLFDGDSEITFVSHPLLSIGEGEFSIAFWLKTNTPSRASVLSIRQTCSLVPMLDVRLREQRLTFETADPIHPFDGGSNTLASQPGTLANGQWHLHVWTRQGYTQTLYVDGELADQVVFPGIGSIPADQYLHLGSGVCESRFIGTLDELVFFNRSLSAEEARLLYERVADFNHDGDVNPDDLADFITCYFSEPPCTGSDYNHDGDVNPDD